jgi:hypothetical protein
LLLTRQLHRPSQQAWISGQGEASFAVCASRHGADGNSASGEPQAVPATSGIPGQAIAGVQVGKRKERHHGCFAAALTDDDMKTSLLRRPKAKPGFAKDKELVRWVSEFTAVELQTARSLLVRVVIVQQVLAFPRSTALVGQHAEYTDPVDVVP